MKLETLFHVKTLMLDVVPLTIQEPGIAYLNDIHLWVITLNSNCQSFDRAQVTVETIIDLMEHHCSCYQNQEAFFEKERREILERLRQADAQERIELPLH